MKRTTDLSQYESILPYASEIFGVYQPMLGWRAKRMARRWERGFSVDLSHAFESLYKKFKGNFEFTLDEQLRHGSLASRCSRAGQRAGVSAQVRPRITMFRDPLRHVADREAVGRRPRLSSSSHSSGVATGAPRPGAGPHTARPRSARTRFASRRGISGHRACPCAARRCGGPGRRRRPHRRRRGRIGARCRSRASRLSGTTTCSPREPVVFK